MNKDYEIYQARPGLVPKEDEARLDGYLRGRAEAVRLRNKEKSMATSLRQKKKKKKKHGRR